MLQAFLGRAKGRGLRLLTGHPVTAVVKSADRVTGVRTPRGVERADRGRLRRAVRRPDRRDGRGLDPSKPYRRQVMVTEPLRDLPPVFALIVDLDTGFYVHRQG